MKSLVRITVTLALASSATAGVASADDAATATIFKEQCAVCHGLDGKAQTVMGKKLSVKDWSDGRTLNGMTDADVMKEVHAGKLLMPGFAQLGADQLKALVTYIRMFQK